MHQPFATKKIWYPERSISFSLIRNDNLTYCSSLCYEFIYIIQTQNQYQEFVLILKHEYEAYKTAHGKLIGDVWDNVACLILHAEKKVMIWSIPFTLFGAKSSPKGNFNTFNYLLSASKPRTRVKHSHNQHVAL